MKNYIEYILSGLVIANDVLPKGINSGDISTFTLGKHSIISSHCPLVTPILELNNLSENEFTFKARCLNWRQNTILNTTLQTNENVLLTPQLNGCTFAVYKDKETEELIACHANYLVEDKEYVYFREGVVDYELYETDEDGELKLYFKSVPDGEYPEDYEELSPEENETVYIKNKDGGYEEKTYIDTRTLNQTKYGTIDQKKIDVELEKKFSSEKYESIFYVTKSDYQKQILETSGLTSVYGVRDEDKGWQFYCFTTGPSQTTIIDKTDLGEHRAACDFKCG